MRFTGRLGIRWKLFGYMMLFLLILLVVLWLFQVVFFDRIYKSVRKNEIRDAANRICESIELDDQSLGELAREIGDRRQMCIMIVDKDGQMIVSEEMTGDCIIHVMSQTNLQTLYSFAKRDGGVTMFSFRQDVFKKLPLYDSPPGFTKAPVKNNTENFATSVILVKLIESENRDDTYAVMINATVSPVASAVRTIQSELIIISLAMVLIAAFLSFLLARLVSKPIVCLNRSAKRLAHGDYGADFSVGGYREIRELSNTLSYAASELAKTEALQRELIANISHDLRTPLTMITGYAEVMRDIPCENTPENVQIIIDEASRLTSLVNDVLDISKLRAGTKVLKAEQFDLTATVHEVIGRFDRLMNKEGYVISFEFDCNAVVIADRTGILQVIYNFINNAITHSGEDRTVTVKQSVVTRDDGSKGVRIEVSDHGEGIDEKDIPYIWDRYYKVDKLHKRAQMGSGLGLSIVKGILDMQGARYGVISEKGMGSTFWFEL